MISRRLFPWLILLALVVYPLVISTSLARHILIYVLLYGGLGLSWNLLGGYVGRVSFGHAAFFGIGAYTTMGLLVKFGLSPWIGLPLGGIVSGLLALAIGHPTLRLKGHYFAMATIALAELLRILFNNWSWVGGATGLEGPIHISWLTFTFRSQLPYYYLALALALITAGVDYLYVRGKADYYWRAIQGDEDAARSLGVPIERYKLTALLLSAVLTGLWGGFFALLVGFINPNSVFDILISIQIVLVAVLGGVGRSAGPWIGALVLIPLSELTRVALGGRGRGIDLIIYGLVILVISVFQPGGILSIWRRRDVTRGA